MKVLNYKKYNVFGFSAGTLTAQYLLKNYSESVHAVIMTAIVDIEENLAASNSNTIETMEKIFRICETEEKYKQAYPDLENRFLQMLDSLNETPVKVEMKDREGESYAYNITGDKIARWLTFGMYWNSQLPVTINKLLNNDFSDFSKLDDLAKYTCDELLDLIQDMDAKISHEDVYTYVTWENNQLAITICFNSSGEFMHIEREVWKDLDVDISYTEED